MITHTPQMPLMLQENFTVKLLEMLRTGEIDCAILAEPFPDTGLALAPLYDEPFMAAVPMHHALAAQSTVTTEALKNETMLLLGSGHCFRDHVLEVCPGVCAVFQQYRGHSQKLRGLFAGDHQAHGGRWHGHHAGAASERAQRGAWRPSASQRDEDPFVKYLPFEKNPPTGGWCWSGGAVLPVTRPLPRCAMPFTPANCQV